MYVLKCIHQRLKWYSAIAQHTSHSITQAQVCPLRNRNSYDHVINSKNIFSTTSQNIVDFSSIVYLQCRRSTPFASVFFLKRPNKKLYSLEYSRLWKSLLWAPAQRKRASMLYFANVFILFIYFLWPPYSPALVNEISRKFYTWWTLSVIREVTTWIFSWSSLNYRVGQKVTKFGVFSDSTRKLFALTLERGRILLFWKKTC